MCYAELQYHSNDYTFMQIMSDVLSVSKKQIRFWKDERIQIQVQQQEEEKMQIDSCSNKSGLYAYNYFGPKNEKQKSLFIEISEKVGRDKISQMIGEKIIGKVFNDNLADFESSDDMDPILRICQVITKVLGLLKELDVKQRAQIES